MKYDEQVRELKYGINTAIAAARRSVALLNAAQQLLLEAIAGLKASKKE